MRLVGIEVLNPGDKLAMPILTSSGKVILNYGIVITDSYINRLKMAGIKKVYIEDNRFSDVDIDLPIDLNIRNNAVTVITDIYQSIHKKKNINEFVIKEVAKNIADYARDSKEKGVSILSTNMIDEYVSEHSINVAILSAFMGIRLNYNFSQLCDLVTAALIHDLGRENTRDENPEHVNKGFEVMRTYRGLSLHSSIVCYEHHENFDGSGYPRKLKGTSISEFTRIIRVADYYDNILYGYDNGEPVMPHQAYEYLLAASGTILDPAMVEIFRDTIIFYPNGCTIQLSNGLKGVVVRQNTGSPQRPVVRIFNNTSIIGEIDLFKSLSLFVKDTLAV